MQDLACLSGLTQLSVFGKEAPAASLGSSPLDVSPLSALGQLQQLRLHLPGVKVTGMQALGWACAKLSSLGLIVDAVEGGRAGEQQQRQAGDGQGQGQDMAGCWPSLREARFKDIAAGSLQDMGLCQVSALQNLQLGNGHRHLGTVAHLVSLRTLVLTGDAGEDNVVDVSCLAALVNLSSLDLCFTKAGLKGMHAVGLGCRRIAKLSVRAVSLWPQHLLWQQQQGLPSSSRPWPLLAEADLAELRPGSLTALGLQQAPKLAKLRLCSVYVELSEVVQLTALTELDLLCGPEDEADAYALDVGPLAALKLLQHLHVALAAVGSECSGLTLVARKCTRLSRLSFLYAVQVKLSAEEEALLQPEQQGAGQEVPWWPALTEFIHVGYGDADDACFEPGHVALLQLQRARQLQTALLPAFMLKEGSPASEPAALRQLCEQMAACPEAARPTKLEVKVET